MNLKDFLVFGVCQEMGKWCLEPESNQRHADFQSNEIASYIKDIDDNSWHDKAETQGERANSDIDDFISSQMERDKTEARARLEARRPAQAQRDYIRLVSDDFEPGPAQSDNFENDGEDSDFFSASSLEGRDPPVRKWLVRDLVPSGTVTLLSGDGGTGKSLIALQLAYAVATGGVWLGNVVAAGEAFFISAEDDKDELHRRLDSILLSDLSRTYAELNALTLRSLAGEDALLAHVDSGEALRPTDLFRKIERYVSQRQPKILILDTLADLFPGNENDRAQARQFIGMLRGLAIRQDCAVLLLAHPSLSGLNSGSGTSGSTAWNNSVRSRLYLERVMQDGYEPNPDARRLSTKKANYSRTGQEITMTWCGGVFEADTPERTQDGAIASVKAERVFLNLLQLFCDQGRRVNHAGGRTYAPNVFANHPNSEGVSRRAFTQAMEALLTQGKVRVSEDGPASKRRSYLEAHA